MYPDSVHHPAHLRSVFAFLIRCLVWLAAAWLTCAATGCGRENPPVPALTEAPRSHSVLITESPDSTTTAAATAPEIARAQAATSEILSPGPDGDLTETLNGILTDYADAHGRVPKDLAEMVRLKLIPRIPEAPPGKRFLINAERREIALVNK
jgi:hypothetical protein